MVRLKLRESILAYNSNPANFNNAGSIPATSTNFKNITMENLYEQLQELIDTIKYSHAAGDEDPDYLENDYFEDVVEACKEIVKYTKE